MARGLCSRNLTIRGLFNILLVAPLLFGATGTADNRDIDIEMNVYFEDGTQAVYTLPWWDPRKSTTTDTATKGTNTKYDAAPTESASVKSTSLESLQISPEDVPEATMPAQTLPTSPDWFHVRDALLYEPSSLLDVFNMMYRPQSPLYHWGDRNFVNMRRKLLNFGTVELVIINGPQDLIGDPVGVICGFAAERDPAKCFPGCLIGLRRNTRRYVYCQRYTPVVVGGCDKRMVFNDHEKICEYLPDDQHPRKEDGHSEISKRQEL